MAWASSVLPVPVSPSRTTGTSDLAARAARRRQRAIASLVVVKSSTRRLEGGRGILSGAKSIRAYFHVTAEWVRRRIQSKCVDQLQSELPLASRLGAAPCFSF